MQILLCYGSYGTLIRQKVHQYISKRREPKTTEAIKNKENTQLFSRPHIQLGQTVNEELGTDWIFFPASLYIHHGYV